MLVDRRIVFIVVAPILLFLAGYWSWREQRETFRLQTVARNNVKAQRLKENIDRRLPIGTSEGAVLEFLRKEHPLFLGLGNGTSGHAYELPVAREPSEVWYCSFLSVGVRLTCRDGRLVGTDVIRWGMACL